MLYGKIMAQKQLRKLKNEEQRWGTCCASHEDVLPNHYNKIRAIKNRARTDKLM